MRIGSLASGCGFPGSDAVIRGAVLTGMATNSWAFSTAGAASSKAASSVSPRCGAADRQAMHNRPVCLVSSPSTTGVDPESSRGRMARLGVGANTAAGGEEALASAKRLTDAPVLQGACRFAGVDP